MSAAPLNREAAQAALLSLVSVCDGAHDRDNAGFSAADVWHGNFLARLTPGEWQEADEDVAAYLLTHYRKQLAARPPFYHSYIPNSLRPLSILDGTPQRRAEPPSGCDSVGSQGYADWTLDAGHWTPDTGRWGSEAPSSRPTKLRLQSFQGSDESAPWYPRTLAPLPLSSDARRRAANVNAS